MSFRVGHGMDIHPFSERVPGEAGSSTVTLGGTVIPHGRSLTGHSDADVLTHAIMDALLGAAGLPDIGHFFPNTDERYRGAKSVDLLAEVGNIIGKEGWRIENIDTTLLCETPKIAPHIMSMKSNISRSLGIVPDAIGIKATTAERLGSIGREEGVAAWAVALLAGGTRGAD